MAHVRTQTWHPRPVLTVTWADKPGYHKGRLNVSPRQPRMCWDKLRSGSSGFHITFNGVIFEHCRVHQDPAGHLGRDRLAMECLKISAIDEDDVPYQGQAAKRH